VLRLARHDFDWMTPAEFQSCVEAYNERSENELRLKYELSRFNAWLCLAPHLKNKTAEELFRFPWEEIKKGKVIDGKTNAISKVKSSARRGK
jgi:hypothetical protein